MSLVSSGKQLKGRSKLSFCVCRLVFEMVGSGLCVKENYLAQILALQLIGMVGGGEEWIVQQHRTGLSC